MRPGSALLYLWQLAARAALQPVAHKQNFLGYVSHGNRLRRRLDFEVIIVDDNSPDGTQDVVRQLQQAYGEDRIVRHTASHPSVLTSPALLACLCPYRLGIFKVFEEYRLWKNTISN